MYQQNEKLPPCVFIKDIMKVKGHILADKSALSGNVGVGFFIRGAQNTANRRYMSNHLIQTAIMGVRSERQGGRGIDSG